MATIGTWGNVVFCVSRSTVRTFDALKMSGSAKYATHDRHLKKSILERTGTDAESLSIDMYLSAYLGVNPIAEAAKLDTAMNSGKTAFMVVGGRRIGQNKWVITSLSKDYERFGRGGTVTVIKVSVSMKEYAGR